MLSQEMRMAVLTLRKQGHGSRKIARDLGVGRNAVREVIASGRAEVSRAAATPPRLVAAARAAAQVGALC
jgi:transcriptional regulator